MPDSSTPTPSVADLTLLGHSENRLPRSPEEARLEVFANRNAGRNYWIELDYPEFSSLCPVTGQPDSAHLTIRYIPDRLCLETKSLKFYLASFRNLPSFNEDIVNRILDELSGACAPRRMIVKGRFSPRGGIRLTATAAFPDPGLDEVE
ncbi:MAG: preQ(1) synthase [Verrucomicrobia bacterium]|nr:preQ(1) synthase [Verrucomicrobiota bacterium]